MRNYLLSIALSSLTLAFTACAASSDAASSTRRLEPACPLEAPQLGAEQPAADPARTSPAPAPLQLGSCPCRFPQCEPLCAPPLQPGPAHPAGEQAIEQAIEQTTEQAQVEPPRSPLRLEPCPCSNPACAPVCKPPLSAA
jgi:hypothetical protein